MLEIRDSPLSKDKFKSLVEQLLLGMDCIHNGDMAHNDIKLENIMYNIDTRQFLFIDFGLSCKTRNCMISGSTFYLPPEFIGTDEEFATLEDIQKKDLWGLGISFLLVALWDNPKMRRFEQSDIYNNMDFGILAMKTRRPYQDVLKDDLPQLIKKAVQRYNNTSVKFRNKHIRLNKLLDNLLNMNPQKRKIA